MYIVLRCYVSAPFDPFVSPSASSIRWVTSHSCCLFFMRHCGTFVGSTLRLMSINSTIVFLAICPLASPLYSISIWVILLELVVLEMFYEERSLCMCRMGALWCGVYCLSFKLSFPGFLRLFVILFTIPLPISFTNTLWLQILTNVYLSIAIFNLSLVSTDL